MWKSYQGYLVDWGQVSMRDLEKEGLSRKGNVEIIPRVPCGLGSGFYAGPREGGIVAEEKCGNHTKGTLWLGSCQGRRVGRIVSEREMWKSHQGYLVAMGYAPMRGAKR